MSVDLLLVRTQHDLDRFIRLPWRIYCSDPNWVPPLIYSEKRLLDKKIHPFHKHSKTEYYLCLVDGKPAGRIAAIINHQHNTFHRDKTGFWGFFESIDDHNVVRLLFTAVEDFLRANGMTVSRGPLNFSINETCGLLIDGFDSAPFFMMTHNSPYYLKLIESLGYIKAMDLLAFSVVAAEIPTERLTSIYSLIDRDDINIRNINIRNFQNEIKIINEIYNDAWQDNWGFVPMTADEVEYMASELKHVFIPELGFIAEFKGDPIGFAIALPNVNRILKRLNGRLFPLGWLRLLQGLRKIDELRVITLGVKKQFQRKGLGAFFYLKLIENGIRYGCRIAELSWVLETNLPMITPLRKIGAKESKRYRIYEKVL